MLQEPKFSLRENPHNCSSLGSEENLKNVNQIFKKEKTNYMAHNKSTNQSDVEMYMVLHSGVFFLTSFLEVS